jgi:hypothetical protein
MSDTELTDTEAARLRQLLHRAADSLPVTTPDVDSIDLQPVTGRPGRGRWLLGAAAVLTVVLAAAGAVWLLSDEDSDQIDTGPAEPPVTVAPQVLEQAGIWRLPEGLDGYRVVGAQDAGLSSGSNADRPGVLAVDDPDDPQRWLLVQAYDELGELPPTGLFAPLSDQVDVASVPSGNSLWFRLTPTGDDSSDVVISGAARGIGRTELLEMLARRFGTVEALSAAAASTTSMEALLDDAGFGDPRLVWLGGADDPGPGGGGGSVQLSLVDRTGTEFVVALSSSDTPPWAQLTRLRLITELMSLPDNGDPGSLRRWIRTRPDLGRRVLESTYTAEGMDSVRSLAVLTGDGTLISVSPVAAVGAAAQTMKSLSTDQQLRIINSLRAMSEDEFRAWLAELGAEFIGADSVGVTTTVVGEPGG